MLVSNWWWLCRESAPQESYVPMSWEVSTDSNGTRNGAEGHLRLMRLHLWSISHLVQTVAVRYLCFPWLGYFGKQKIHLEPPILWELKGRFVFSSAHITYLCHKANIEYCLGWLICPWFATRASKSSRKCKRMYFIFMDPPLPSHPNNGAR